ncbi:MAG: ATP-binding cassette domain-containing protein [Rhodoferax sp.]|nr:ATP-binding cassette domain-containing protein [Rhodoferax sp.]MDP3651968.1 ATP-binding cassette domain-containing protein [Rhodoferax sp.]
MPNSAIPPVLQCDGLCFHYPQRTLFAGLSARIPPGVTLVRGGDGSGKTTLLRLLAGTLPAQGGALQAKGVSLKSQPETYRQQVFWADPQSNVFDQTIPLDYFKAVHRSYPTFDETLARELAEGLSLTPHLDKPLYMLSTGSKRKVWLAASFASGAAVTLLDDPFAALDKTSIAFVMELLHDAADHFQRAWLLAHYQAPGDVPLALTIDLGD